MWHVQEEQARENGTRHSKLWQFAIWCKDVQNVTRIKYIIWYTGITKKPNGIMSIHESKVEKNNRYIVYCSIVTLIWKKVFILSEILHYTKANLLILELEVIIRGLLL